MFGIPNPGRQPGDQGNDRIQQPERDGEEQKLPEQKMKTAAEVGARTLHGELEIVRIMKAKLKGPPLHGRERGPDGDDTDEDSPNCEQCLREIGFPLWQPSLLQDEIGAERRWDDRDSEQDWQVAGYGSDGLPYETPGVLPGFGKTVGTCDP